MYCTPETNIKQYRISILIEKIKNKRQGKIKSGFQVTVVSKIMSVLLTKIKTMEGFILKIPALKTKKDGEMYLQR